MDKRFHYLWNKYIKRKHTEEEFLELMRLVKSGRYDDKIEEKLDQLKNSSEEVVETESEKKEIVRSRVLHYIESRKTIQLPRRAKTPWKWIAAAAFVMSILSAVYILVPPGEMISQREDTQVPGNYSGRQFIDLPDGSTVILNDNSRLTYEGSFGNGSREVFLTGEAYFDIKHDPDNPFIVRTGKLKTTVLGTAFNVKAYEGLQEIIVTVTRGKVAVGDDERVYEQLLSDEQLAVNTLTFNFEKTSTNVETVLEWKSQFLILDRVTMEEAAAIIGNHYSIKVTIANEDLKKCKIKATFLNGEDLQQVAAMVSRTMKATYRMKDGNAIIEGGVGCK